MSERQSKWRNVIRDLQAQPGVWMQVAEDAAPSLIQLLRKYGAEVDPQQQAPRGERNYARYTLMARWPVPETQHEELKLQLLQHNLLMDKVTRDRDEAQAEVDQLNKLLGRARYRARRADERYRVELEKNDRLVGNLNALDHQIEQLLTDDVLATPPAPHIELNLG